MGTKEEKKAGLLARLKWHGLPWSDKLRLHLNDSERFLLIWILTGIVCGLAAVFFHLSIDGLFSRVMHLAHELGGERTWLVCLLLAAAPALGGLITGWLMFKEGPSAAGSGIPQTKARYYRDFGYFKLREAIARFIIGTLSVGSGMSLGREGPTVHICATLASCIGQAFGLAKKRVQAMVPIGMGAGIAAAFNTPMSAIFFVFEELLGDFSSKSFFGILVAVVIAAAVERIILGEHPAFSIFLPEFHTSWWMLICVPLGLAAAFTGTWFVRLLLRMRQYAREQKRIPIWMRPAFGGLGVGIIGAGVYWTTGHNGIFAIGYADLSAVLNGQLLTLGIVLALLIGKSMATLAAYASGASGGLFAPALFIGAMLGATFGIIGQLTVGLDAEVVGAIALLGMGAFFAAVVRCPMTSIVIIWEMTGLYSLILPLMAGNILAWLLASKWQPVPLYDALLLQDKINLRKMPHYQGEQDWRNLPVSTIMTFDVVTVDADLSAAQNLAARNDHKHHGYPVISQTEGLIGMIMHHELEEWDHAGDTRPTRELLSKRALVSVSPETSIRDVAQTLVIEDVLQAPVVSKTEPNKLIGIVTLHDIARQQNAIADTLERQ